MTQVVDLTQISCRFYCRADLPKYALGESGEKEFAIHFYLADDTVEVRELRTDEAGRVIRANAAAGKKLVRRQRLPREKISSGECE